MESLEGLLRLLADLEVVIRLSRTTDEEMGAKARDVYSFLIVHKSILTDGETAAAQRFVKSIIAVHKVIRDTSIPADFFVRDLTVNTIVNRPELSAASNHFATLADAHYELSSHLRRELGEWRHD